MYKVKVKGIAVKLNGVWRFKDDTEIVDEKTYTEYKDYLDVIEKTETDISKENETPSEEMSDNTPNEKETPEEETTNDISKEDETSDEELEALRDTAKKLGIKNVHNMKKETLIAKIEETKKGTNVLGQIGDNSQNPDGE